MLTIKTNTYPGGNGRPGDIVEWRALPGGMELVRLSDEKTVFLIDGLNRDGVKYSNGKQPVLVGLIAEVKKNGWKLELNGGKNV